MMDMYSRNQYLKELRKEYLKQKSKKEKGKFLPSVPFRKWRERKFGGKKGLLPKPKDWHPIEQLKQPAKEGCFFV